MQPQNFTGSFVTIAQRWLQQQRQHLQQQQQQQQQQPQQQLCQPNSLKVIYRTDVSFCYHL
jgi:hypothetical protein